MTTTPVVPPQWSGQALMIRVREILSRADARATPVGLVTEEIEAAVNQWLTTRYDYLLPNTPEQARSAGYFAGPAAHGHVELKVSLADVKPVRDIIEAARKMAEALQQIDQKDLPR